MESPNIEFRMALKFIVEREWKGRQKILADKAGVTPSFISQVLKGRKVASATVQVNIAKALEKTHQQMISLGEQLIEQNEPEDSKDHEKASEKTGKEEQPKPEIVHIDHMRIVEQFQDKETAYDINRKLLEIEREAPDLYNESKNFIDYNHQKIDRKKTAVGDSE